MKSNRNLWIHVLGAAALVVSSLPAQAGVTIDRASPSIAACPVDPGDIFRRPAVPAAACPGPGPIVDTRSVSYGLAAVDDTDALATREAVTPATDYLLIFSGDTGSQGLMGTPYRGEFAVGQAAGDLWRTQGPASVNPAAFIGAGCGAPAVIAAAWPNLLRNQHQFNLAPSILPGAAFAGAVDDVDGFEMDVLDVTADQIHDMDFYFSVDPTSAIAASPADILGAPAGGPWGVWAPAAMLGLAGASNNIDALVVWDGGMAGVAEGGIDLVLFSFGRGSLALRGPDGVLGTADDFSPADLFVSNLTGFFCLYLRHNQLGLRFNDNLDALDVQLW